MNRLIVNPGTPQAWEIQLKPGANRIGRGDAADFQIPHPSVSTTHCEITVTDQGVHFKDLGSTNGSFLNGAPVTESALQPGQRLQLGGIALVFEGASAAGVAPVTVAKPLPTAQLVGQQQSASAAPPVSMPPPPRAGGLRVSISKPEGHAPQPVAQEAEAVQEEESAAPPPMARPAIAASNAFCKSHMKSPARFYCPKCRHYFCDMCVATRNVGGVAARFCRHCGGSCTPVSVRRGPAPSEKGFFAKLPGAFIYPLKGMGVIVLIMAAILFSLLQMFSGIFNILLTLAAIGYLFVFMQNIIHTTAADEKETLSLAAPDDLFASCFRLIGIMIISFGIPIGMAIANFFDAGIPWMPIFAIAALGCFYFPMCFLAVAMKDNIMAASPMVVFPSIFKLPFEYLVASILFLGIFAFRFFGNSLAGVAENVTFATKNMNTLFMAIGFRMLWSFLSVYLLTVNMRIMGLLYVTKKDKLGWF